jgi:hypothetical protein
MEKLTKTKMNKIIETKDYGIVEIRNAMFDIDGTTLEEGIEIKGEEIGLIELYGWRDIEELSSDKVNELIKQNKDE